MAAKRQRPDGSFPDSRTQSPNRYANIFVGRRDFGSFSWLDANANLMRAAVAVVTKNGDGISFAVNRDQSSGSVTILAGPDRPKYYAANRDEADELLRQLAGEED